MASSGVNVLRYAALIAGVGYGFSHQASLVAKAKVAQTDRDFENQANLISKAKAEWVKKTMPKEAKEGGVISDPSDPKFDLEAYLTLSEAK